MLTALLIGAQTQAVTVQYESTDLPDLVAGQGRWSFHYENSGNIGACEGVNLLNSADGYENAQTPHR
ncbi:MAG: hypothetical protein IPN78_16710 [Candidatus Accumulibacter sp.]|nr:hypothetical protein [Candidatus Accumulibacter propinquus]